MSIVYVQKLCIVWYSVRQKRLQEYFLHTVVKKLGNQDQMGARSM
jgi:hypothetical protein